MIPNRIFLLIGQSNMAGRGPIDTVEPIEHPHIHMFRDGQWVPAAEPRIPSVPPMCAEDSCLVHSFILARPWRSRWRNAE